MTGRDAFKIWAPAGAQWVNWARPVPFAGVGSTRNPNAVFNPTVPGVQYIDRTKPQSNTAVIVDAPGPDGVKEGIALAKIGFRPVPLYNGTNGQKDAMALVDSRAIAMALVWGAAELAKTPIPRGAPPAFLLDSNRTLRYKMDVSVYDNSWDLYAQDMPSAGYLLQHGITGVIVRGAAIQKDLGKILYTFQKEGIAIFFTNGYHLPNRVALKKPFHKSK